MPTSPLPRIASFLPVSRSWVPAACCALCLSCGRAELERARADCDAGEAAACRELGELRLKGVGGPKSRKDGREAFERACDLGDGAACGMAGSLVYARRDDEARRRLRRGCDLDHPRSCTTWAWMLLHGEGGGADPAAARAAFDKACDGGEAAACVFAALAIRDDSSVDERDTARERDVRLRRACDLGDARSCDQGGRE